MQTFAIISFVYSESQQNISKNYFYINFLKVFV